MLKFVVLNKIERGRYNEDTGATDEIANPATINVASIRCFYGRHDSKPGTRITFTDGGGFAVHESPAEVAQAIAGEPQ